jgi:hypothetical protein
MKSRLFALAAVVGGLLVVSVSAYAHHGRAIYDESKSITVKGTVSAFSFVNPHVQVFFDVKGDQGNVEKWVGEATSPNMLVREGWTKNLLKPGDQITATGYRSRTGSYSMRIEKLVLPSGREILPLT